MTKNSMIIIQFLVTNKERNYKENIHNVLRI